MSAPTKQFHKLSIGGNMPDRRTQAERRAAGAGSRRWGDDDDDSELMQVSGESEQADEEVDEEEVEDEEEDVTELSQSSTVQARSGITYDLAHLDPDSEARALLGLTGRFDEIYCESTQTGYDFRLSERPQVHIGSDTYTCTCSAYQSRPDVACQHIFWLLDQLHGCFMPQPPSSDVPLLSNGHSPQFSRVEHLLDGKLEMVAEQLNWQYSRSEVEGGMSRPQKVRDIMSAFSTVILPEDFRLDLVEETTQLRTPEQCVVQGDFEATMFRLAVHNDEVYASLCKAMPPGACAAIYFDKVQEKTRKLLADFDRYCLTGQLPAADGTGTNLDVDAVVNDLQRNVDRVQGNIIARAPHGTEGAAKTLITILEDICNRDKDALDGNRWGRASFNGEDEDQRNLYHRLVGKADETGEYFVLDALEHIPATDLHQFGDKMSAILHRNEVNRGPKSYILKLNALVRLAESASSGSGQKRPATATTGGNSKRTR
ncbi:hypothetical protein SI65_07603 [Aspergillus cristatus]|uniref:SWIM-type domain-containing protein n=1 Tax=Aspergillus cristatus TaxID=573508 RepID=A0A1E3B8G0_ASPCR|nr:hypothetical protein SI65_07603 [Aspergillus cristatus]